MNLLVQSQMRRHPQSFASKLGHLGAAGLFFLAILDSSPIPTFGGPDILTAMLAAATVHCGMNTLQPRRQDR